MAVATIAILSRLVRPLAGTSLRALGSSGTPVTRSFSVSASRCTKTEHQGESPSNSAEELIALNKSTERRNRVRPTAKGLPKEAVDSAAVLAELKSLQIVPLGQQINQNDLEKQDDNLKRRRKLAKAAVQMKKVKPSSPSLRWYRTPIYPYLHKGGPVRELTVAKRKQSGRNNRGRITVRHQGGGHKRRIRLVDFFRLDQGPQTVVRIEYDPGRSGHIALLESKATGALSYILACEGLRAGDVVESFRSGIPQEIIDSMGGNLDPAMLSAHTAQRGNCLPLSMIPLGTIIHNISITAKGPGKLCRSAGTYGRLFELHPDTNRAVIRLQSGEYRYVALDACATIGMVSNPDHQHRSLGKAGRSRHLGIRPTVRGVAMNKIDHPHGGGRGKSKGKKISMSKWGVKAKSGFKTRRGKNVNRMLVKDRPRGKAKKAGKS